MNTHALELILAFAFAMPVVGYALLAVAVRTLVPGEPEEYADAIDDL
mgnify:CR=1 FL=1